MHHSTIAAGRMYNFYSFYLSFCTGITGAMHLTSFGLSFIFYILTTFLTCSNCSGRDNIDISLGHTFVFILLLFRSCCSCVTHDTMLLTSLHYSFGNAFGPSSFVANVFDGSEMAGGFPPFSLVLLFHPQGLPRGGWRRPSFT